MKKGIFVLCVLLCASAAFGQIGNVLNNEPQIIRPITHPEHASPQTMSVEQNLLITSAFVSAQGDRPLWEFATVTAQVPLGDSARLLRKEHASVKKATKVWEN